MLIVHIVSVLTFGNWFKTIINAMEQWAARRCKHGFKGYQWKSVSTDIEEALRDSFPDCLLLFYGLCVEVHLFIMFRMGGFFIELILKVQVSLYSKREKIIHLSIGYKTCCFKF